MDKMTISDELLDQLRQLVDVEDKYEAAKILAHAEIRIGGRRMPIISDYDREGMRLWLDDKENLEKIIKLFLLILWGQK